MSNDSFSQMRLRNADLIVSAVRDKAEISRADIARDTKLSPATVSSIVDELVKQKILQETGAKSTALGRRPIGLVFNPEFGHLFGISLDANKMHVVLINLNGNIVAQECSHYNDADPAVQISDECIKLIKLACRNSNLPFASLAAGQLAVRGPVAKESLQHRASDSVHTVIDLLSRNLSIPVYVDSLVNMAAMAECAPGSSVLLGTTAYVRIGHAMRSGILVDGRLMVGKDNRAGELGHVVVPGRKNKCSCGNIGCLNGLVSMSSFLDRCHKSGIKLGGESDFSDLLEDDRFAELLADTADCVAIGLASLINILAPESLIVSAPYFSCGAAFQKPLLQSLSNYTVPELLRQCRVICKQEKGGAEAYGAALNALSQVQIIELLNERL